MKTLTILLIIFLVVFSGCLNFGCRTGIYSKEGKCCSYVCDQNCPNGYVSGTCNCECKDASEPADTSKTNVDTVFDDGQQIDPPEIPN